MAKNRDDFVFFFSLHAADFDRICFLVMVTFLLVKSCILRSRGRCSLAVDAEWLPRFPAEKEINENQCSLQNFNFRLFISVHLYHGS
jgi:hypothetical protein